MKYEALGGKIILSEYNSFDISETLECGQCFRFVKLGKLEYIIIANGKVLRVLQQDDITELSPCTAEEFENIWLKYFDLEQDYSQIKAVLSKDDVMSQAIGFAEGIRILNQEPWECLLSFIISQNMNIPRIKQIVHNISEFYGDKLDDYYAFPTISQLKGVTTEDLAALKTGFRAKYLKDAIDKISSGQIEISGFPQKTTDELKKILMSIYGVGEKVADCTLLFSCMRHECFPMDVWIRRVMSELYFNGGEASSREVHEFAAEKFGGYAGYAQQYLFHYGRNLKGR